MRLVSLRQPRLPSQRILLGSPPLRTRTVPGAFRKVVHRGTAVRPSASGSNGASRNGSTGRGTAGGNDPDAELEARRCARTPAWCFVSNIRTQVPRVNDHVDTSTVPGWLMVVSHEDAV